jgi:DNA invertase Pin-like site-specific DNA recombinase
MHGLQKLTPEHLARRAIVYLRQSSEAQVHNNLESQDLQYALRDRARGLGFQRVEVLDVDLGASAGIAAKRREGFERLLGSIALGEVGLVLSRELSRLSRTDKDFCQLIELCQAFGTLLGDEEAIYDPARMDDQLVLGIKATMSAVELRVLRMRLQEGKENKARRGELYPRLPPGYVWDGSTVVKDPDARVQESIHLVFTKFGELWSARQTFKWFRDNGVELPVTRQGNAGQTIVFQRPRETFVSSVLHNPFYAGAYTWGRRPTEVVWRDGRLRKRMTRAVAPNQARVFIQDHHEGYIDWATFEENQRMMRRNNFRGESDEKAGAVRAGQGLLTGMLRCGRCGRKLQVRYAGRSGTCARYQCSGDFAAGGDRYCIGFAGARVERRVGEEVVKVLSPLGVRASLDAIEHLASRQDTHRQAITRQVQQLEYEAARAFEQYNTVDPRNRLVAAELERRWNAKLAQLDSARVNLTALDDAHRPVSEAERDALLRLGERFADVWNHSSCPITLRKQIIRLMVEEIVADEVPEGRLSFVVRWTGGRHTKIEMEKPDPKWTSRTSADDLEVIRKLALRYDDRVIAGVLSKLGRRTGKGKPWSAAAVKTARRNHDIEGGTRWGADSGVLTLQAAVQHTGTSDTTLRKLVRAGVLSNRQSVPFAPWEIDRRELDSERVQAILAHLKRTGRLVLDGGTSEEQGELFE